MLYKRPMPRRLGLVLAALVAASGCDSCEKKSAEVIDAGGPFVNAPAKMKETVEKVRSADTALQAGNLDDAIEKAEAAVALEPLHPIANNVLGRAAAAKFAESKDPIDARKAEQAFKRAAQANPTFWPAYQNLGELLENQGRLKEAGDYYRSVLAAEPNHPDKARFMAVIEADAG
jgi:tetratricopeptide (TPR) repeat protein